MARLILLAAMATVFGAAASAQTMPRSDHPPDYFDGRGVDAARIAPDRYVVEMDNDRLRVLRVKIPAATRVPIHGHRSGVIIALTPLSLRLTAPDGRVTDVRLPAGDMRWIEAGVHAEENTGATACEYLFIESK